MSRVRRKYVYDYPLPAVTVDMVILTVRRGKLMALLVKRGEEPFKGHWAVPGVFVDVGVGYKPRGKQGESLIEAAERGLLRKTGLERDQDGVYLDQLVTIGTPHRDPRGRVVTVVHYALVSPEAYHRVKTNDGVEAEWHDVDFVPRRMAFEHDLIIQITVRRVRREIDDNPDVARALLPREFTKSEYRHILEVVKGSVYDPSNFSRRFRRMLEDGKFIASSDMKGAGGIGRPAKLYRFPGEFSHGVGRTGRD